MKLYHSRSSPFSRKVRIAAHELALSSRIELVEINPWSCSALRALNPLSKVPTLRLGNGQVLYESTVICEFLASLGLGPVLYPPKGEALWRALLLQGLADGASTAAGRLYADERRLDSERSSVMMDRFQAAIDSTLDHLEAVGDLGQNFTIGEISVGAFVGYLDFRWPDRDWRAGRPWLSAWYAQFAKRPSMTSTKHR
jgi:glutathione S-transferase